MTLKAQVVAHRVVVRWYDIVLDVKMLLPEEIGHPIAIVRLGNITLLTWIASVLV
jgi:hypothetical protein